MKPLGIFISSVQREFAEERAALRDYLRGDPLMRRFFDPFLFEDVPATDRRPDALYLDEVERCELYVGLFGDEYGTEDEEGLSHRAGIRPRDGARQAASDLPEGGRRHQPPSEDAGAHRQGVRLFFVEKFSPYSWAFLPADASLQCSVRGDSNQASTYPRLSGGQPSLETVPNTVGLSPSGALPSGHSRGVLVRFHGQGDRPVMAVTTGFQGRRFDVPEARTGVPRIDLPSPAPCAAADAVFADAKAFLSSNEARQMSESELERELHRRGQKLVRKLLQGHHDQRSPGQAAGPAEDASGVECSAWREHDSHAETTSGTMQVVGLTTACIRSMPR